MAGILQHAEQIMELSHAINRSVQGSTATRAGPFTRAMLETPLGDLIRDVDPSEIGLFTLVPSTSSITHPSIVSEDLNASAHASQRAEIARIALPIATPLRKPPSGTRRGEDGKRITEHDPEVYINAALRLLDRYQSIRPMPRFIERAESLRDQVATVRESIAATNSKLKELDDSVSGTLESPEAIIEAEERRIADLQAKIADLRKQKETLLAKKRTGSRFGTRTFQKTKTRPAEPAPAPSVSQSDVQEDEFWSTPGAPVRALKFSEDLLTDERIDVSDAEPSMSSPLMRAPAFPRAPRESRAKQFTVRESLTPKDNSKRVEGSLDDSLLDVSRLSGGNLKAEVEEEDTTVVLNKRNSPPRDNRGSLETHPHPTPEPESVSMIMNSPSSGALKSKIRFKITTEMENIVTKIWQCMGDTIMPGHTFDKPPHAKETIAHLQALSTESPSPDSPSVSSLSSLATAQAGGGPPTAQQIHTARILLALLSAPPNYSMPLNALKEVLNNAGTRPIYACVAKRLLRIERGGGEQVVKFDL